MPPTTGTRYVFVTGGVSSSLGKGICGSSFRRLLVDAGLSVRMLKPDPYLNVDPGTMNPFEHGEAYVTSDIFEADLSGLTVEVDGRIPNAVVVRGPIPPRQARHAASTVSSPDARWGCRVCWTVR